MAANPELTPQVAAIRELFGAAACSCALVDDGGAHLVYVAADGEGSRDIVGVSLPVGRGIAGWAAMSGQPIALRDVRADPRFARDVAEATRYVPTSMMAAPMFDAVGETLGVISVLDPTVDEGSGWGLAVLGTLAAQVAALVTAVRHSPAAESSRLAELGRRVLEAAEEYQR